MAEHEIEAIVKAAVEHQKAGRLEEAEKLFQRAIAIDPNHCGALHYMGLLCQQKGNLAAALDFMRRSVERSPGAEQPHYHNNLATALGRVGRLEDALLALDRALALRPDYAESWGNRGVSLEKLGRLEEAEAALRKAIELKADFVQAHTNLAAVLGRLGREEEALTILSDAAARFPKDAELAINYGNALRRAGKVDQAIAALRRAVERRPNFPEGYNNLGVALHDAGLLQEAESTLRKAIELRPSYAEAHWNLSLVLLHRGDFHNGWLEYEWRRHLREDMHQQRNFPQPPWTGGPLQGRRILVLCEQGLGDTLQFVRYVKVLADRGAKVLLECQPRLTNLLKGVEGIERVIARGEPLPPFDCHVRLMSIAGMVGTDATNIPAQAPYVRVDPEFIGRWRDRLDELCPRPAIRVGIAWQGNPAYRGDGQRSIPLSAFAPLAQIPGVKLFSLQKGKGSEQVESLRSQMNLMEFDPPLDEAAGAFFDTAAVMLNLDLVITSDTSIAHLAGALGVRSWVALPMACDWRWQDQREDSPWYPSFRLFRQKRRGDWTEVFGRISQSLAQEVRGSDAAASFQGSKPILVPVSAGELLDKITILRLKSARITDPAKLAHVREELGALEEIWRSSIGLSEELDRIGQELLEVNTALWDVEDAIRRCESQQAFGPEFIELARSVYRHNDRRCELKRRINGLTKSALMEEKSYGGPEEVEAACQPDLMDGVVI